MDPEEAEAYWRLAELARIQEELEMEDAPGALGEPIGLMEFIDEFRDRTWHDG